MSVASRCLRLSSLLSGSALLRRKGMAATMPLHKLVFRARSGTRRRTEHVWQLSARPLETFGPPLINSIRTKRWQVAAALSAAVTTTKLAGNRAHLQAEPSQKKQQA